MREIILDLCFEVDTLCCVCASDVPVIVSKRIVKSIEWIIKRQENIISGFMDSFGILFINYSVNWYQEVAAIYLLPNPTLRQGLTLTLVSEVGLFLHGTEHQEIITGWIPEKIFRPSLHTEEPLEQEHPLSLT